MKKIIDVLFIGAIALVLFVIGVVAYVSTTGNHGIL